MKAPHSVVQGIKPTSLSSYSSFPHTFCHSIASHFYSTITSPDHKMQSSMTPSTNAPTTVPSINPPAEKRRLDMTPPPAFEPSGVQSSAAKDTRPKTFFDQTQEHTEYSRVDDLGSTNGNAGSTTAPMGDDKNRFRQDQSMGDSQVLGSSLPGLTKASNADTAVSQGDHLLSIFDRTNDQSQESLSQAAPIEAKESVVDPWKLTSAATTAGNTNARMNSVPTTKPPTHGSSDQEDFGPRKGDNSHKWNKFQKPDIDPGSNGMYFSSRMVDCVLILASDAHPFCWWQQESFEALVIKAGSTSCSPERLDRG